MSSVRGKLADHVKDHAVLSPEEAVLVIFWGRNHPSPPPPIAKPLHGYIVCPMQSIIRQHKSRGARISDQVAAGPNLEEAANGQPCPAAALPASKNSTSCHPGPESTLKPIVTSVNASPAIEFHFQRPFLCRWGIAGKYGAIFSGPAASNVRRKMGCC